MEKRFARSRGDAEVCRDSSVWGVVSCAQRGMLFRSYQCFAQRTVLKFDTVDLSAPQRLRVSLFFGPQL